MKVYSVDDSIQRPKIDFSFYNLKNARKEEAEYVVKVKEWLHSLGYTSPNTGRLLVTGYADGAAVYMFCESANKRKSFLVHIDIGDAYDDPLVHGLTKTAVMGMLMTSDKSDTYML